MSGERLGRNARNRIFQHFKNRENNFRDRIEGKASLETSSNSDDFDIRPECIINGSWVGPLQMDSDDVDYLFNEVWRSRCSVTGESLGTVLELSRWDMSKPSNCQNIVILGVKAMKRFDDELINSGDGRNSVSFDMRRIIEARLETCKVDSRA